MHILTSLFAISLAEIFGSTPLRIFLKYDMSEEKIEGYLSFIPNPNPEKRMDSAPCLILLLALALASLLIFFWSRLADVFGKQRKQRHHPFNLPL